MQNQFSHTSLLITPDAAAVLKDDRFRAPEWRSEEPNTDSTARAFLVRFKIETCEPDVDVRKVLFGVNETR